MQMHPCCCSHDVLEADAQRCSVKKVFLEIPQNSQKNTFARVSDRPATLLKKRLWHRCFPVDFAKFQRTLFLTEHLRWLLLISIAKMLIPDQPNFI